MTSKDYNIFQGDRFIDSMRSSGYKDTSYAVAELVDNAIDAKAKHIEILCREKINHATNRYHLDRIAKAKHIEILCREKINHATNRYHLDMDSSVG